MAVIDAPIVRLAPDTIRLERLLDAPVETVWDFLTKAELRQRWFMGGSDAAPGQPLTLEIDHDRLSDGPSTPPASYASAKGKSWQEEVLRFEPPSLLETTFQGGANGRVTYELRAEGERTRLVLTHRGIVSAVGAQDFGGGWTSHLAVLEARLRGGGVSDFWALHARSREQVRAALNL